MKTITTPVDSVEEWFETRNGKPRWKVSTPHGSFYTLSAYAASLCQRAHELRCEVTMDYTAFLRAHGSPWLNIQDVRLPAQRQAV